MTRFIRQSLKQTSKIHQISSHFSSLCINKNHSSRETPGGGITQPYYCTHDKLLSNPRTETFQSTDSGSEAWQIAIQVTLVSRASCILCPSRRSVRLCPHLLSYLHSASLLLLSTTELQLCAFPWLVACKQQIIFFCLLSVIQHMKFRREIGADTILEDWTPPEVSEGAILLSKPSWLILILPSSRFWENVFPEDSLGRTGRETQCGTTPWETWILKVGG